MRSPVGHNEIRKREWCIRGTLLLLVYFYGMRLRALGESAIIWNIIPAPDDVEYGAVGGMIGSRNRSKLRTFELPDLGSNSECLGGKSATNGPSYGTANSERYSRLCDKLQKLLTLSNVKP
jgi:hypothetical protein